MSEPRHISEVLAEILETQKDILSFLRNVQSDKDNDNVVSIAQAANITGRSTRTIRRYIDDGKIRTGVKAGRKGVIESDLKRVAKV